MYRALFTSFCFVLMSITTSISFAQSTTPSAKAIGTGPWADGLTHVMQGTDVGRGCLEVQDFQIVSGKALYACLTLEDQRYHVVHDTEIDSRGYSRIENLKISSDGKVEYRGYEGEERCYVSDTGANCSSGPTLEGRKDRIEYIPTLRPERVPEPTPALPKSFTGGKTITDYKFVNNQPLWVDCDEGTTQCRMRWNGHAEGKMFYRILWENVLTDADQVAYIALTAKEGDMKVIWGQSEGETFTRIWGFDMLNRQPIYVGEHANSLNYLVRGRQKEAFRSIDVLKIEDGKVFLVGSKDPAPGKSPI